MRDFEGFRFGNLHSSELNLIIVSSSSRFNKNLLPSASDYTTKVPDGNGSYYFGSTFDNREFNINVAFDNISESDFRRISQVFATDQLRDLVFDEMPFKTYKAKIKSKPEFKFICFSGENNERIYKGEGTLNFICYSPFSYCYNKYVVRAADHYNLLSPNQIIEDSQSNPYKKYNYQKVTPFIKNQYNVKANMHTPWKGGYPTIEQVQNGELYFNDPTNNKKKMIIDVRGYWNNIPEWQSTAKLLTTPTLDYDQELIFAPQYSKTNYYNMDTGMNQQNAIMGSRILVYNPGDVPVDFELKLGNLSSNYRANLEKYKFRISRYNVQRLTIEQAVDWTGLKTYHPDDEGKYKYGNRYLTVTEPPLENEYEPQYKFLKNSHPKHTYLIEPIPREELGYFIRLFYWQSSLIDDDFSNILTFEEGETYANRYEELYEKCITDEERFELYWKTLKDAILSKYELASMKLDSLPKKGYGFINEDFSLQDFYYDYIYNPPEYVRTRDDLKFGQFDFNIGRIPNFYTLDYLDINNNDFDKILDYVSCGCDIIEDFYDVNRPQIKPLVLDSEKRMLYTINRPEWKGDRTKNHIKWQNENPDKLNNFYNFKPQKVVFNDNIEKGQWFKLPPGWSMIDISPVVDEDMWGGKTWLSARRFKWGTTNEEHRDRFEKVYCAAAANYLATYCPQSILDKYGCTGGTTEQKKNFFKSLTLDEIDQFISFREWYQDIRLYGINDVTYSDMEKENGLNINKKGTLLGLGYEFVKRKTEQAEYGFLKMIAEYWRVSKLDDNGMPCGDIDDWWWYANNYIWANFPPLYWGYADLVNKIQIDYIPLFY